MFQSILKEPLFIPVFLQKSRQRTIYRLTSKERPLKITLKSKGFRYLNILEEHTRAQKPMEGAA